MPRLWYAAFLATLTVAPAAPAPRPKDKAPPVTYWPTQVGATFEFQMEAKGRTLTRKVTAVDRAGDVTTVTMGEVGPDGRVGPANKVEIRPDGLYITEETGEAYHPPLCLVKTPVKQGQRWATASKWGDNSFDTTREVGETKVLETPAGKIEAVPISVLSKGSKNPSVYWFARAYGIVQVDGHRTLKAYTPGK